MPAVNVNSEIGRLRQVLVHRPGLEIDRMVPDMMEELLFDDILDGDGARREHDIFQRVLRKLGVEVLDARDLLEETLALGEAREWMLGGLLPYVSSATEARIARADATVLTAMLVDGVMLNARHESLESDELFEIPPLPNWCFQRDPQVVLGGGVIISAMATPARWREEFLAATVFRFHPRLSTIPRILDPLLPEAPRPSHLGLTRPHIEGGDLLVMSRDVILIGLSERTNRAGVHHLARALSQVEDGPRWLLVAAIPARRAFMHLDTLFTVVDRDCCLAYPPVITGGGSESARMFEIDLQSEGLHPRPCESGLLASLRRRGVDLEPIPCGGSDPLSQQREQWTDGANSVAVAPGLIVLYDRNRITAAELARRGFKLITAEDLLQDRVTLDVDQPQRACVLVPSHELSRARGGPHCLTQPLVRDDL